MKNFLSLKLKCKKWRRGSSSHGYRNIQQKRENAKLREELLAVEEDRMAGRTGTTVDELDAYLDDIIEEV